MANELETAAMLPPMHPGEMLREEYMKPLNLSAGDVAGAARVPAVLIEAIRDERAGIGVGTALRFARVFRTTPEFWLNLQRRFDLETETRKLGNKLDKCRCLNPERKE